MLHEHIHMHKAPLRLRFFLRLRILNYARHQSKPRRNLDQTRPPVHTHQIACCLSAEANIEKSAKKASISRATYHCLLSHWQVFRVFSVPLTLTTSKSLFVKKPISHKSSLQSLLLLQVTRYRSTHSVITEHRYHFMYHSSCTAKPPNPLL